MSDITMCFGTDCPIKENCYRYTATANEYRQSYFTNPPYKKDKCDYFWGDTQESIWQMLLDITKDNHQNA